MLGELLPDLSALEISQPNIFTTSETHTRVPASDVHSNHHDRCSYPYLQQIYWCCSDRRPCSSSMTKWFSKGLASLREVCGQETRYAEARQALSLKTDSVFEYMHSTLSDFNFNKGVGPPLRCYYGPFSQASSPILWQGWKKKIVPRLLLLLLWPKETK